LTATSVRFASFSVLFPLAYAWLGIFLETFFAHSLTHSLSIYPPPTTHHSPLTRSIRVGYELVARLCPNTTGAELRSVCTEAGMFAIRARRKSVSEKDFLDSINKVIKGYSKFSSTPKYMVYN